MLVISSDFSTVVHGGITALFGIFLETNKHQNLTRLRCPILVILLGKRKLKMVAIKHCRPTQVTNSLGLETYQTAHPLYRPRRRCSSSVWAFVCFMLNESLYSEFDKSFIHSTHRYYRKNAIPARPWLNGKPLKNKCTTLSPRPLSAT